MTLVRVLKPLGFEQVGDVVDYRGNVDEAIARGDVELFTPAEEAPAAQPEPSVLEKVTESAKELLSQIEEEVKQVEDEVEGV